MPEPGPLTDEAISKMRLRTWLKLLKTSGQIEGLIRQRLRDQHGTTLPRFDVMSVLARFPDGLKMSELSTYLRVSNGNVTGIVDKLTQEDLVERVAVPGDRRAQLARMTPKGFETFEGLAQCHEAWINELLSPLEPGELEAFSATLGQISDD